MSASTWVLPVREAMKHKSIPIVFMFLFFGLGRLHNLNSCLLPPSAGGWVVLTYTLAWKCLGLYTTP